MMLGRFVFFAHLCVLCMGSARPGYPDYEYFPDVNGWLKVHTEPTNWKSARINCHNEGALLASPWSDQFTSTVHKLQAKYPSLAVLYSGAGLTSDSTGVPMEACDNKRCRVFLASGSMDKVNCEQLLPYACYAPEQSCGNGYLPNSQTGQCYKFHEDGKPVPQAKAVCQSEGGYLAKINSLAEKAVLGDLSDGASYIDNDDGGTSYRHMGKTDFSDYPCDAWHNFICEKDKTYLVGSNYKD